MVNAATLERVRAAADRLGYVPNRAARQLAGGRTAAIAVIVPDVTNPFFAGVVQAVQRASLDEPRLVLLADTAMRPGTEIDAVESLAANVDGVIVCSPMAPVGRLRDASRGRPLVLVNRRARGVSSVEVDQQAIVTLALDHVTALGHRRIGVTLGPRSYWSSSERARCLHRLDPDASTEIVPLDTTDPTFEGGRACIDAVIDSGVTAVLAFNDVMALGLVSAASDRGLTVPRDLSVVGSDGVPIGEMAVPALTTVVAPMSELGRRAVLAVDQQLASAGPTTSSATPRLVVRASTAPPRRARG
jgi:DNA-binding LacI/PurR family transcriptional regulator